MSKNLSSAIEAHHANVAAGRKAQQEKATRDLAILDLLAAAIAEDKIANKEVRAQLIAAKVQESKANHMANDAARLTRKFTEAITADDFMAARIDAKLTSVTSVRALEAKPKTAIQIGKAAAVEMLKAKKAVEALTPAAYAAYEKHLAKLIEADNLASENLASLKMKMDENEAKMEILKKEAKAMKEAAKAPKAA